MTNRTNSKVLLNILRRGARLLGDFAYGIDAGSAIRHGLPVPPRHGGAVSQGGLGTAQRGTLGLTPPVRSTE